MSWIDRPEALRRLGVKPQTLYAYVSRGLIAARPADDDPRASVYSVADIAQLVRRKRSGRRRRAIAEGTVSWGEPILETRIATVRDGRLIYAGRDAVAFAEIATLEDAARLLWRQAEHWRPATSSEAVPSGASEKHRALLYLAAHAANDAPSFGRAGPALADEAFGLLSGFASALVARDTKDPVHTLLGDYWRLSRAQKDVLRRALVLVADHELNPSTFAARVAASTGASLAGAALAGFATLTGPAHGEAARRALTFLDEAAKGDATALLRARLAEGLAPPAVGHTLYPDGDPRAAAVLEALAPRPRLRDAIAAAEDAAGGKANIDMALAALTLEWKLGPDAPLVIFAAGRMVGWMAHAMEQRTTNSLIRPRATYMGE